MKNKNIKIILEDQQNKFLYEKNKSNLNISFNRISFIFFIFFIFFLIYSIHLIHLGSRKANVELNNTALILPSNNFHRADIVDRNGTYLVKTVNSTDIGISTQKVIDKKKLIINLRYIFPEKDYKKIQNNLENKREEC